jgi:hypothetical protein
VRGAGLADGPWIGASAPTSLMVCMAGLRMSWPRVLWLGTSLELAGLPLAGVVSRAHIIGPQWVQTPRHGDSITGLPLACVVSRNSHDGCCGATVPACEAPQCTHRSRPTPPNTIVNFP